MSSKSGKNLVAEGRLRVIRQIGEGGMGVVYEAEDRQRGGLVAVKTLRDSDAQTLLRLKREFRSLADVSHANLIDLYELVIDGEDCYFTMELIEGSELTTYCSLGTLCVDSGSRADTLPGVEPYSPVSARSRAFDEDRLRVVLPQLIRGLEALHDAGIVHRDVKPSNVLVTHSGRVVILDFGLAAVVHDWESDSLNGKIVGTAEYMAPEQAAAEPASAASDLYSVGCILYEILTGTLPFTGSVVEIILSKQESRPEAPSALGIRIPSDLESICMDLLQPRPGDRPSADEVLRRLGARDGPRRARVTHSVQGPLMPFAGRQKELGVLSDALNRSRTQSLAVLVTGPSGIGKTAVVRAFTDNLRASSDHAVLEGRCLQSETVPYKAIDGLLDQLAALWMRMEPEEAVSLLPTDAALMARLFPALGRVPVVAGAAAPDPAASATEMRQRALRATHSVLQSLARRRHLVAFLDDLQWADAESLSLICEGIVGMKGPGLALLCQRDGEGGAVARSAIERVIGDKLTVLEIGPLAAADAARVVSEFLVAVEDDVVRHVVSEARGVPFLLTELALYVQTIGDDVRGPATLDEVLKARIDALPGSARDVVELVAVSGQPVTQRVLASALNTSPEALARVLRHLRTLNILRAPGGRATDRVECYHNRIRESVLGSVSRMQLTKHYRSLAIAMEQWAEAADTDLARLWEGAGDARRAGYFAYRAALHAEQNLDFHRAAVLFQLTLDLGGEGQDEQGLRVRVADCLRKAGRPGEAAVAFTRAADSTSGMDALTLRHAGAAQLVLAGDARGGVREMREVLAELGLSLDRAPRGASLAARGRRIVSRLRRSKTRREEDVPKSELAKIDIVAAVTGALSLLDPARGYEYQSRHLDLALRCGEPRRVLQAIALEGCYQVAFGNYDVGESFASRAEGIADEHIDQVQGLIEWLRATTAHVRDSRLDLAIEHYNRALVALEKTGRGMEWERPTLAWMLLSARFDRGDLLELASDAEVAIADARRRGDLAMVRNLQLGALSVWMATGRRQAVERAVASLGAKEIVYGTHEIWWACKQIELALWRGEDAPDTGQLRRQVRSARLGRLPLVQLQVEYLLARVAVRSYAHLESCERRRASYELQSAARRLVSIGSPLALSLADFVRAGRAEAIGNTEDCLVSLERGIDRLDAVGPSIHAEYARLALGYRLGPKGEERVAMATRSLTESGVYDPELGQSLFLPLRLR